MPWEVLHLRRQNKTKILRIQWTHPVLLQIFSHINVISDSYASLSCLSLSLPTEQTLTWLIFEVKLEFSTIDYICLLVHGNNFIELAVRKIHCLAFTENFQRSLYKQKTSRKNFCDLESRHSNERCNEAREKKGWSNPTALHVFNKDVCWSFLVDSQDREPFSNNVSLSNDLSSNSHKPTLCMIIELIASF